MSNRNHHHPVRLLLNQLAIGDRLTNADLDDLELDDDVDRIAVERTIRAAAKEIKEARAVGHNGLGRQVARECWSELQPVVGEPVPVRHDDDLPDDPRELADLIEQRRSGDIR